MVLSAKKGIITLMLGCHQCTQSKVKVTGMAPEVRPRQFFGRKIDD